MEMSRPSQSFCGFPHTFQGRVGIKSRLGDYRFPSNSLHFIIHTSSHHIL